MNVLVIVGHPRANSFAYALAEAYCAGARKAGARVEQLDLAEMVFDPDVQSPSPNGQALEPDLGRAQELIRWADHLVFVYPTWWGTMPARLKGFLDRVLTSGFAFDEVVGGVGYEGRLRGKSAHLITTMDTPSWVYRWIYRSPGHNAMRRATLQFCGLRPVRVSTFGPVKESSPEERAVWLARTKQEGLRLRHGAVTRRDRIRIKAVAWLQAIRLQFYPMTWVAYTAGALGAAAAGGVFANTAYWVGYLFVFFLEVATVLSNDYFDYRSDVRNRYYSPFSGGSRVLVEERLSFAELRGGIAAALVIVVSAAAWLFLEAAPPGHAPSGQHLAFPMAVLAVLALGYTMPPLKLSHRGLGELDVGLTHSIGVILCGYVFLGGRWTDPFPWLLSVPLFSSVLPSILLAGIPDYEADRAASKNSLVVKVGLRRAVLLAMIFIALAAAAGTVWHFLGFAGGAYDGIAYFAVPHAFFLEVHLYPYWREAAPSTRIDKLIVAALTYILWFGLVPLFNLL